MSCSDSKDIFKKSVKGITIETEKIRKNRPLYMNFYNNSIILDYKNDFENDIMN